MSLFTFSANRNKCEKPLYVLRSWFLAQRRKLEGRYCFFLTYLDIIQNINRNA